VFGPRTGGEDRVGGRTLNADIGGGKIVEVGGQFIGHGQHTIGRIDLDIAEIMARPGVL
jgi:monoamine oxidase